MPTKYIDAFFQLPRWMIGTIFTAFLIFGAALGMYYPLFFSLPFMVVLPVCVALGVRGDRFEKIKLTTLIIGRLIVILAFITLIPGDLLVVLVMWLLRINILEATLQDLKHKRFFSVLSGVALIASTWFITIQWTGVYYVILPATLIFWVFAYTIWNWNFVYRQYGASIGLYHVPVLLAPLIFALVYATPTHWLMMRAGSLTLAVTCQILLKGKLTAQLSNKALVKKLRLFEKQSTQAALTVSVLLLCAASVVMG